MAEKKLSEKIIGVKPPPLHRELQIELEGAATAPPKMIHSPLELMNAKAEKPKLIFVYNADGGTFNLLTDIAHKIFSPATYACNLCALTHSNFGMRKEWKKYLAALGNPLEFLHADEFKNKYPVEKVNLPAIFIEENGLLSQIADVDQINRSQSIQDLKVIIEDRLKIE